MSEFLDRADAGRRLGQRLAGLRGRDVVVLGLPRGGVPVAFEVAKALDAPLDVIMVRKLGVPFQPELAMGAIGEGGARVLDERVLSLARVTEEDLAGVENRERGLLADRTARYRQGRPRADLHGRTAIVVDDGIATGSTARVACRIARQLGAARVVLAVPVAPARAVPSLKEADDVVCLATPRNFRAVGYYYYDFSATGDDEVVRLLDGAERRLRLIRGSTQDSKAQEGTVQEGFVQGGGAEEEVEIQAGDVLLEGSLYRTPGCEGIVIFAHGSGSSRQSPRNRYVASVLHDAGLGTLLLDLLTPAEEVDRTNVFDIALLARRLGSATRWVEERQDGWHGRIGYFGASTGAGAALWAAAEPDADIGAVVSRGGRPDLAGTRLAAVRAPTLLIVGGADAQVLALNREARSLMRAATRLEIVPGATHLFEEPGTLARAAELAAGWFSHYLPSPRDGNARREVRQ